jgi:hypothetical protein
MEYIWTGGEWERIGEVRKWTDVPLQQGLEEAKAALTKVKDEYTMYYNHRCEPAPVFTPGDRAWLDGCNIATNRPSSKLSH